MLKSCTIQYFHAAPTHIIGRSVAEHIVECLFLRNVFRSLADDNGQLYFVIGDVFRDWLRGAGDVYGCIWANNSRRRLIE
jgi:hypothetical protein